MLPSAELTKTLLWVDDDQTLVETGCQLLRASGVDAEGVTDGRVALRRIESSRCAAVILDLNLPGLSGITVLANLREMNPSLPVSILTGCGGVQEAVVATRLGIVEFREKPMIGDDLVAFARRLLPVTSVEGPLEIVASKLRHALGGPGDRIRLARRVVCDALLDESLSAVEFLAVCVELRRSADGSLCAEDLDAAALRLKALEPDARALLGRLERGKAHEVLRDVAAAERVAPKRIAAALRRATGSAFPLWRIARRVRPALPQLLVTDEQVAQVAYGAGYQHPTQFNRDVRRLLGTNPSQFRRSFCHH
ncbi:MAG: DNA-binding response regulator [Acidobacteriota bacterium]|nr:DNA-binding response regulator [Acidobacteriota bacterium]